MYRNILWFNFFTFSLNKEPYTPHSQALIRNYEPKDAADITEFNRIYNLAYQYNGDYKSANIFCAEMAGKVVASGHLEPSDYCDYLEQKECNSSYKHRFLFETDSSDYLELEQEIFEKIMIRAKEIKQSYPDKKIQIGHAGYRVQSARYQPIQIAGI